MISSLEQKVISRNDSPSWGVCIIIMHDINSMFKLKVAFINLLSFYIGRKNISSAALENVTQIKIRRQLQAEIPEN